MGAFGLYWFTVRNIKPIQRVIDNFESLPGIGPKTAQRLAYYLLRLPQDKLDRFAMAVGGVKKETKICQRCFNVDETNPCRICDDQMRNQRVVCVVETPLDLLALERSDSFKGVYHVLHGLINPLGNVGPSDIYLPQLLNRISREEIEEIILATNPSMEGEATAMYITNKIRELKKDANLKITRIGRGLPTGADLEYADELTLNRAMEGRREM